jgi:spiro-SPASM protein
VKTIAVMDANVKVGPLGMRSRLGDDLCGKPVLHRTIERFQAAKVEADLFLATHADQANAVGDLAGDFDVKVETHDGGIPPWNRLMQIGRKWAIDSWRGGIAGMQAMDERLHPAVLAALAQRESADAVVFIPADAVLLDPYMLREMHSYFEGVMAESRLVFAEAPPGLTAWFFKTDFLAELASAACPAGALMAYNPDKPEMDIVVKPCCYKVPPTVASTSGRLLADTRRGFELCEALIEAGEAKFDDGNRATQVCRWLQHRSQHENSPLPRELEIELTTEDQLSGTLLRPRGTALGRSGQIDVELVRRLAIQMSEYDDSIIVLGGFGEPLLHPEFDRIVAACREADIFGLAVRTNALAMDDAAIDAMMNHKVDVVNVLLDAVSAEGYEAVHGVDGFAQAVGRVQRLSALRIERQHVEPIVLPEIVKANETFEAIEAFYDQWIRSDGGAVIRGYSDRAGQLADRQVMRMAPPVRTACRQIGHRATVLADGRMVVCDQDFRGMHAVGHAGESPLSSLWLGSRMEQIRQGHQAGEFGVMPLCSSCGDWHRP